jgi:predicted CoA-binding protein
MPATMPEVRDFLALRRIAIIGVSRDPKDFSRYLLRQMCDKGYDIVPVNPAASDIDTKQCFARVQEIEPPVEGALIMTSPHDTERVVRDCAEAGIRHIWMHRGGGPGSVSPEAVKLCHQYGLHLVEGHCPLMFLTHTPFYHRIHGFLLKLTGSYPHEALSTAR